MLLQENCGKVNHKLIKKKKKFCFFFWLLLISRIKYVGFYFHQNIYSEIMFPHDWIGYFTNLIF